MTSEKNKPSRSEKVIREKKERRNRRDKKWIVCQVWDEVEFKERSKDAAPTARQHVLAPVPHLVQCPLASQGHGIHRVESGEDPS